VKLREPATFWTDCGLAAWSACLAALLVMRSTGPLSSGLTWWVAAFVTCFLAATAGAVHHGLGHGLSPAINRSTWQLTLLSLIGTGFCLTQIAALNIFQGTALSLAQFAATIVTAILAAIARRTEKFSVAIFAYGFGQLLVLMSAVLTREAQPPPRLPWLAAAVATSALAAGVQFFRLGPSRHFNHNDLYHLVQAIAQGAFYFAAATY
jgi:hypothetical protein